MYLYCESTDLIEGNNDDSLVYYRQNSNVWAKLHTIMPDYELWKNRIEEVSKGEAVIELFCWDGEPDMSNKVILAILDKDSGCGVQEINLVNLNTLCIVYNINNAELGALHLSQIAKNEGLSLDDFKSLFKGYGINDPLAIIHFTKFRY